MGGRILMWFAFAVSISLAAFVFLVAIILDIRRM